MDDKSGRDRTVSEKSLLPTDQDKTCRTFWQVSVILLKYHIEFKLTIAKVKFIHKIFLKRILTVLLKRKHQFKIKS